MAVVSEGDKFLVSYRGNLFNQQIINTFWYRAESVIGTPDTTSVANAFNAKMATAGDFYDTFLSICPPSYVLSQCWIQDVDPVRIAARKFNLARPGTFAKDTLETNVATVITRRGQFANKHNISSLHVPYPSLDNGSSGGTLSNALFLAAANVAALCVTSVTLAGLCTMRPIIRNGPAILQYQLLQQAFVQDTIRVMRRRTVRVGI